MMPDGERSSQIWPARSKIAKKANWGKKPIVPMLQRGKTSMPLSPSLQIDSAAGVPEAVYPAATRRMTVRDNRSLLLVILRDVAGSKAVADRAFKSPPF